MKKWIAAAGVAVLTMLAAAPAQAGYAFGETLHTGSSTGLAGAVALALDPGGLDRPRALLALTNRDGVGHVVRFRVGSIGNEIADLDAPGDDIAVDPETGNIFVSSAALKQVVVLRADGSPAPYRAGIPNDGVGTLLPNELERPRGIAFRNGSILVADTGLDRIGAFDSDTGHFAGGYTVPNLAEAQDLEVTSDNVVLHIADGLDGRILHAGDGAAIGSYQTLGGRLGIGDTRTFNVGAVFLTGDEVSVLERRTPGGHESQYKANFGGGPQAPRDVVATPTGEVFYLTELFILQLLPALPSATLLSPLPDRYTKARTASFNVRATNNDHASRTCRLDGGAQQSCNSTVEYTNLPDGDHVLEYWATDNEGKGPTQTFTWTVDNVAPVVSITGRPADRTKQTTATFTFAATEESVFECSLDGAAFASCAAQRSYAGLGEGTHTLAVRAKDRVGNVSAVVSDSWTVDLTGPPVSFTSGPASGSRMRTAPTYAFSSPEAGAILNCSLDGGAVVTPCASPRTIAIGGLADGLHTFAISATDDLGNTSGVQSRTFVLDRAAAEPGVTGVAHGTTTANPQPTWTFTHGETGTTYRCSVDSPTTLLTCPSTFKQSTVLPDGSHTLRVQAVDDLGNQSTIRVFTFTVDTTPPAVPVISSGPEDGAFVAGPRPEFAFASTGPGVARYRCSVDSTTMSDCGSPFKPAEALADGEHVFRVEAVDHVGNASARAERTFVVDSVAPVTAAEGVADGTLTNDATPTYALTADEEGATFLCAVDDAEPTPCDASYTPVALTDGKHTLRFTAVDRAGTPDATPEVRTLTVDTTAPETAITSGPAEGSSGLGTSATFVFAGGEGYVCSLDGGAPSSCSSPLTITGLTVGPHKLVVAALDAAGNADATPVVRTFTVLAPLGGAFFGTPALTKRTVSYRKKRLKTLKFALSCPAGAMRGCTGTAVLEAGKKTLGVGRFTLRGGESGTLTIELGRTGRKRLAKAKRTGAVLTVTPKEAAVGKLPVTLRRR